MFEKNNSIQLKFDIADYTESRTVNIQEEKNKFLNISPKNYLKSMEKISTKKSLIPLTLINIMDKNNKIYMNLDEMSKLIEYPKTGLSVLFGEYKKIDFMIKVRTGVYMVNPLISYKGSKYERDKLLKEYNEYKDGDK